MATSAKEQGYAAEYKARLLLERAGLHFIEANYRCLFGEIDLIMKDRLDLVFVEVRARHRCTFGHPLETISRRKIERIQKTAQHYLQRHQLQITSRFDVVTFAGNIESTTGEWIKHAFEPCLH